jgi:hypothetical protein
VTFDERAKEIQGRNSSERTRNPCAEREGGTERERKRSQLLQKLTQSGSLTPTQNDIK